jgi:hypothetical protein
LSQLPLCSPVKVHRGRVMEIFSVAELVRLTENAGVRPAICTTKV